MIYKCECCGLEIGTIFGWFIGECPERIEGHVFRLMEKKK